MDESNPSLFKSSAIEKKQTNNEDEITTTCEIKSIRKQDASLAQQKAMSKFRRIYHGWLREIEKEAKANEENEQSK